MDKKQNLVWIDLEMTGLRAERDVILEYAMIITDGSLNILHTGPQVIIHYPATAPELVGMDAWVREHHAKSGLLQAVEQSSTTIEQTQEQVMQVLKEYCVEGKSPLCGNSVWQDAIFMRAYMPRVMNYLHYRIIDVSSVKELIRRWYPHDQGTYFVKKDTHRALTDIQETIEELQQYRRLFFRA